MYIQRVTSNWFHLPVRKFCFQNDCILICKWAAVNHQILLSEGSTSRQGYKLLATSDGNTCFICLCLKFQALEMFYSVTHWVIDKCLFAYSIHSCWRESFLASKLDKLDITLWIIHNQIQWYVPYPNEMLIFYCS